MSSFARFQQPNIRRPTQLPALSLKLQSLKIFSAGRGAALLKKTDKRYSHFCQPDHNFSVKETICFSLIHSMIMQLSCICKGEHQLQSLRNSLCGSFPLAAMPCKVRSIGASMSRAFPLRNFSICRSASQPSLLRLVSCFFTILLPVW